MLLVTGLKTVASRSFRQRACRNRRRHAIAAGCGRAVRKRVTSRVQSSRSARDRIPEVCFLTRTDHYSAVHTCNTWAAETLRAGGLPVHAAGVIFAGQLWTQMSRLQRE